MERMSSVDYLKAIKKGKKNKYNAKRTIVDGINFPSELEASYYSHLKIRVLAGEVLYFLRQVPFHLPGGVKYVVDFMEIHADGSVHYVDVKGKETRMFITKKKIVEALYPVEIEVVKRLP